MPNSRGREVPQDHRREQERSGSDRDAKSDDDFDFESVEEAEGGSAEESTSECGGNSRKEEPKPAEQGVDEANQGEKAKSENESETADSVRIFDLETLNQLDKRKKGQQKMRQHRESKGSGKGCTCRQADRKSRGARNRTGRGARVRHEARRSRSEGPEEQVEPRVELEGQC